MVLDLPGAVVVADHVVREDDRAEPCERDASGRDRTSLVVFEPPLLPVAVRAGDGRTFSLGVQRPVEVAGHVKAGVALEPDFLNRVTVALQRVEGARVQRRSFRFGVEARGCEPVAQIFATRLQARAGIGCGLGEVFVRAARRRERRRAHVGDSRGRRPPTPRAKTHERICASVTSSKYAGTFRGCRGSVRPARNTDAPRAVFATNGRRCRGESSARRESR